jgi:hypothetical protein
MQNNIGINIGSALSHITECNEIEQNPKKRKKITRLVSNCIFIITQIILDTLQSIVVSKFGL